MLIDISIYKQINNKDYKKYTCCFTGYRPQKCPWGFNEQDNRCIKMKKELQQKILEAIENGYNTFIIGMALGFDMICAEILLEFKKQYKEIKLIGAIPCKNQDNLWSSMQKERYRNILKQLDEIRCKYDTYIGSECMFERNKFIIDNSSLLIALFDGKSGGTQNTIEYAKTKGIKIVIIKP